MSKQIVTELRMLGALMLDPRPKSTVHGAADEIEAITKQNAELAALVKDARKAITASYEQAHAEWHGHHHAENRANKVVLDWRNRAANTLASIEEGTGAAITAAEEKS